MMLVLTGLLVCIARNSMCDIISSLSSVWFPARRISSVKLKSKKLVVLSANVDNVKQCSVSLGHWLVRDGVMYTSLPTAVWMKITSKRRCNFEDRLMIFGHVKKV